MASIVKIKCLRKIGLTPAGDWKECGAEDAEELVRKGFAEYVTEAVAAPVTKSAEQPRRK